MTKKIVSLFLAVILCASLAVCVSAADHGDDENLVMDSTALLTDGEAVTLRAELERISHTYGAQVCIGTVESLNGEDMDAFVESWYDEFGCGYGGNKDGVLLLVSKLDREYRILSNGFAADAISFAGIDDISNAIQPYLTDGDYAEAFHAYAEKCEYYLHGHLHGFPFKTGQSLVIALVIGLVAAFVVTGILKGQLKSVRRQTHANIYVKPGSMQLTQSGDFFMYCDTIRTAKPSSSSASSSGGSRKVGGGRF